MVSYRVRNSLIDNRERRAAIDRRETVALVVLLVVFAAMILLRLFVFNSIIVKGESMCDTLQDGDLLIVNKLREPERGDVIVFKGATVDDDGNLVYRKENGKQIYYVKRIIGDSGDTIYWEDGVVSVEYDTPRGHYLVELNEYYLKEPMLDDDELRGIHVPDGKLFVMGDNRNVSSDSRGQKIGFVDKRLIVGVVTEFSIKQKDNKFWNIIFRFF